MLDLDLLRSFVSVVDAGGFTRAGERVHRTQSTVSQQIKRLEDEVGRPCSIGSASDVTPTEAGERLLSYARRLLSLAEEARDVMARRARKARCGSASRKISPPIGWPNCCAFCAGRGRACGSTSRRSEPLSRRDLERGELDLALLKRDAGEKGGIAVWPERLHWVTSKTHPVDHRAVGSAHRISRRMHLSRAGHPRDREHRAGLAHGLSEFEFDRHPGCRRGWIGPQHPLRHRHSGRGIGC